MGQNQLLVRYGGLWRANEVDLGQDEGRIIHDQSGGALIQSSPDRTFDKRQHRDQTS